MRTDDPADSPDQARLSAIVDAQQAIARAGPDPAAVMAEIAGRARALTGADAAVVELPEGEHLVYRAVSGSAAPHLGFRLSAAGSISGLALRTGEILRVDDSERDDRVDRDACRRVGARSLIVVPLAERAGTAGVLKVYSLHPSGFSEVDVQTLRLMAGLLSSALGDAWRFERERALSAALGEQHALLHAIVEGTSDAVFAKDPEGRYLLINTAGARVLGTSPEEVVGRTDAELLPPEVAERFRSADLRALETGGAVGSEVTWADRARARTFIASLRGPEHTFEMTNPPYSRLVGHRDVLGKRLADALPEVVEQGFNEILDGVYRTGKAFVANEMPVLLQSAPGGELEERILNFVYQPLEDVDGSVSGILVHGVEVTEQVRAKQRLAVAEAHYRRLVTSSPQAIFALDAEGRFTEINAAGEAMLARRAAEVLAHPYAEVVHPDDLAMAGEMFRRLMSGAEEALEVELRLLRPSGEVRLVNIRVVAIREGDETVGVHGVSRDITEERETERRLRRVERLASVGTLISGVAHELNNPIHAIRGLSELLILGEESPDRREDLEVVRHEADRMAKIVADLRQVASQAQAEGGEEDRVDLHDVVRNVLHTRQYSLSTHNVVVREDLAGDLPPVWGDQRRLEQVLINLVLNAEQAMAAQERERRITLSTRVRDGWVLLEVADTGPGIPTEHLDRIFDPFWTTRAPGQGTGLGLSLVHNVVTEHRGRVRVESRPGEGTTFVIELPRAPREVARPADAGAAAAPPRPLRVLVVDDEAANRRLATLALAHRGHRTDEAAEGAAALRLLERADYDVIVSDLRMPGLDGAQLLRSLQELGGGMERRLIIVTGDVADPRAADALVEAGVPVLIKPVPVEELVAAVERAASGGAPHRPPPG